MTESTNFLKELQASSTFCIRPWTELHIEEDGKVTPCCVMPANRFPMGNSLKEYFQGEELANLKKALRNNVKHPNCEFCWEAERNNVSTHRAVAPSFNTTNSIEKIHLRLNNVCNFKCRMCGPDFSTTWQVENNKHKFFVYPHNNIDLSIFKSDPNLLPMIKQLIHMKSLKTLNISGGEPLITDANYELLTYLIDNDCTDIQIIYSTNLSNLTYKNHNLIDLWKHFRSVELLASCDGWGATNEYSRTGFNHKQFVKNLRSVFHYVTHIVCVVNIYSIWSIPELLDVMDKLGKKVTFNPCYLPEWLDPQTLPKDLKEQVKTIYGNDERLVDIYNKFIKPHKPEEIKTTIDWNVMLDGYRGTNFFTTFPQFKNYKFLANVPSSLHRNVVYKT